MTGSESVCKNCGNPFSGNYCNNCGEKKYHNADRSVGHVLGEGFHFITHFEGSFFKSLKSILFRPGQLSLDYCNGIQKKYFKPISFFLLLVVLYLLFPVFEGLNMKLYFHEHHGFYGDYAQRQVAELMQQKHLDEVTVDKLFHQKSEKISKFLLFIIIPAMALFSWLISFRKRRYYYDQFIFSIETASFFILWGFLILPLLYKIVRLFAGKDIMSSEWKGVLAILIVFLIQVARGSKRFFGFSAWYSIVYALLYIVAFSLFIEYIYKFILFFITIHLL